ncbi:MAG: hypothetical protein IVW53_03110 [Chloroflexi bacterium]|nr:hypothetical protein [Chloroflexota bacterium]
MLSLEEHRQGFVAAMAAMAALVAEFNSYLDREHANPTADSVGYRQLPLWFDPEEVAEAASRWTDCGTLGELTLAGPTKARRSAHGVGPPKRRITGAGFSGGSRRRIIWTSSTRVPTSPLVVARAGADAALAGGCARAFLNDGVTAHPSQRPLERVGALLA